MFYYCSVIKRAWLTRRSDRNDHSPNRPRAADPAVDSVSSFINFHYTQNSLVTFDKPRIKFELSVLTKLENAIVKIKDILH